MREFKFRAWDGEEFYYFNLFHLEGLSCRDLQQWTGLKDKNGKDIYEGDIVEERWSNPLTGGEKVDRYKIEYNQLSSIYRMTHSSNEERWSRALFLRFKEVEVIGNIHETPSLLERI